MEHWPTAIDASAMRLNPLAQRVEIKSFQRSPGPQVFAIVTNQQTLGRQPDVGLHAAKAVVERIQKRSRVLVVIVRMGLMQRLGRFLCAGERCSNQNADQQSYKTTKVERHGRSLARA